MEVLNISHQGDFLIIKISWDFLRMHRLASLDSGINIYTMLNEVVDLHWEHRVNYRHLFIHNLKKKSHEILSNIGEMKCL